MVHLTTTALLPARPKVSHFRRLLHRRVSMEKLSPPLFCRFSLSLSLSSSDRYAQSDFSYDLPHRARVNYRFIFVFACMYEFVIPPFRILHNLNFVGTVHAPLNSDDSDDDSDDSNTNEVPLQNDDDRPSPCSQQLD